MNPNPTTSTSSSSSSPNESVITRIQKLMAVAARSQGNEHEAANAAARIQEILTAYNLDMAEVESAAAKRTGTGTTDDPTSAKRTSESHVKSAMYTYQQALMKALARNNFCDHWISDSKWKDDPRGKQTRWVDDKPVRGRYVKVHMLLGREVNVIVTRMTYDYLVETMDRLLPYQGMEKRGKDALLWLSGCTDRLVERLDEQRREKEESMKAQQADAATSTGFTTASGQASSSSSALVRLSDLYTNESELNEDFRRGVEPGTTTRERLEYEAKRRAENVEQQRLVDEEGMSISDAWYVARGYDVPSKEAVVTTGDAKSKAETPSARRRREQASRRSDDRYWERQEKKERKEQEKRASAAYRDGHHTGRSIGLDAQVKDKQTPSKSKELS